MRSLEDLRGAVIAQPILILFNGKFVSPSLALNSRSTIMQGILCTVESDIHFSMSSSLSHFSLSLFLFPFLTNNSSL